MKYLKKSDLHLVKSIFRKTVEKALNSGGKVPYSVIYLSDDPLTPKEIKQCQKIIKTLHLNDRKK